jgi:hypothetical protein
MKNVSVATITSLPSFTIVCVANVTYNSPIFRVNKDVDGQFTHLNYAVVLWYTNELECNITRQIPSAVNTLDLECVLYLLGGHFMLQ